MANNQKKADNSADNQKSPAAKARGRQAVKETAQGNNVRKLVSLTKIQKQRKEKEQERVGRTIVYELTDKSRARSPQSVFAINPVHTIYIPHDNPYKEFKGSSDEVEVTGEVTLRYVPGERSLFKHLQKQETVKTELITFSGGFKTINEKKDTKMAEFLRLCPKNEDSPYRGGVTAVYRQANSEKQTKKAMEKEMRAFEVVRRIVELTDDEILSFACVMGLDITNSPDILRISLKRMAEKSPQTVNNALNDPHQSTKEAYIVAKQMGIIRNEAGAVKWDSGNTITLIPSGVDELDYMVKYFSDGQGASVYETIREAIDNIN